MVTRNFSLILLITLFFGTTLSAQDVPDTTANGVYKRLEKYSSKRKVTTLLHSILLRPVITTDVPEHVLAKDQSVVSYNGLEHKIIRKIIIKTYDPFGYSLYDSNAFPRSILEKSGNTLHIKTQQFAIRNQLLFHKNDLFDSLKIKESERLVRTQAYINDVVITASQVGPASDSVDVYVSATDLWSIVADGAISSDRFNIKLSDKNLAGLGHTYSYSYTHNYADGNNALNTYYFIPNIRNSYISSRLAYSIDENENYNKSMALERNFFSPLARWAGGLSFSQQKQPGWIYKNDTTRLFLTSKYNTQDYWAAIAWQIFKGKSVLDRTTKLIFSGRVLSINYLEKPLEQPELLDYYTSENFILSGLGISSRKYVKQSYIFRFGVTEDVPVGISYGIVGGYQFKNRERWYWGAHYAWGNFFKWGYFSAHAEYGSFYNPLLKSEAALIASINYFSGLISIGQWRFRQFVKPELTIGLNRPSYDRLTLNDGFGLSGFNSNILSGTRRIMFIIQTQSYAPWNLLGFRFGPYINFAFGMLGNEASGFSHNRVYPQFGVGVLIRNDYLVVKNLQISFAYYPSIPGDGNNVIKLNPLRTTDFGFQDFVIGKPEAIDFR